MRFHLFLFYVFWFLPVCFPVYQVHAAPTQVIRGWKSHLEQVTKDSKPPCGRWDSNPGPLSEWLVLLATEPSLLLLPWIMGCFLSQLVDLLACKFQSFLLTTVLHRCLNIAAEWNLIHMKYQNLGDIGVDSLDFFSLFYFHFEWYFIKTICIINLFTLGKDLEIKHYGVIHILNEFNLAF